MKKFIKLLGIVLIIALVMSMGTMAFAGADTQHTITVKPVAGQTGAHTYTAYQVFKGEFDSTSKKLSNIDWGAGVNKDSLLAALKSNNKYLVPDTSEGAAADAKVNAFASASTAAEVAEILGANTAFVNDFADDVGKYLSSQAAGSATASAASGTQTQTGNAVITVTGDGYYFVKDTSTTVPDGEALTDYILQVLNNVEITTKSGTVESEKKVDDVNDSTGVEQLKNDSADHDIGDTVSYTLTAKLPADYANYSEYKLVFIDDMSAGLTLNTDSVKIFYGANDKTGTSIQFTNPSTPASSYPDIKKGETTYKGHYYTYTITDLKSDNATKTLDAGDVITITYTATLNEAAVIGSAGNPNTYRIAYSNNPNGEGEGHTPWDKNIVFTYKTVFNKVDADKNPLTGADFTLYKKVKDNSEAGYKWVDVTELNGANNTNPTKETSDKTTGTGADAKTTKDCVFTFAGLDDGDYKLEETTTPPGFNTIDPIEFTITATHELVSDDPKLTSLSGAGGAEFTMTAVKDTDNKPTGELTADIVNQSGAVLPSTGGIGTTIFYVVGSIMVVAAGVLLITKKRMGRE